MLRTPFYVFGGLIVMAGLLATAWSTVRAKPADVEILNVSSDATRDMFRKMNRAFSAEYEQRHGKTVRVRNSHGGSGSQARLVMDGLPADVVTLALWSDTNALCKKGLIDSGWEDHFPGRSLPYYSTIVFVVRKGNPKGIHNWADLQQDDIKIITANPKTSGGARLCLLAAWGSVLKRGGSAAEAQEFITKMYHKVPILDSGARGATITFARRGQGDVQITWENEAQLEARELPDELEVVYPSCSIRAEPHVAVVDKNVGPAGSQRREAAEEYLQFMYTDAAQEIIAQEGYRPSNSVVMERYHFHEIDLFPAEYVEPKGWTRS